METQPSENCLADMLGPFYTASSVATWLNIQDTDVEKRVRQRQLLGCVTADARLVLPVAQFGQDGAVPAGLQQVLDVLATGVNDPWTWGLWLFSSTSDQLEGMSAMKWLKDKRDLGTLLTLARDDASSWSA